MRLEDLIYKNYDSLNQSDLYIWNYISGNRKACADMTIEELAKACNVSRTTILRFAKKISLKGFSELKVYLKWEQEEKRGEELSIEELRRNYHKGIDSAFDQDYTTIFQRIYDADRLFIFGTGTMQQALAGETVRLFLDAQEAFQEIKHDGINLVLKTIKKNDIVFIVSFSGENDTAVDFAQRLKAAGMTVISITKLNSNRLSRLADEKIYIDTVTVQNDVVLKCSTTSMFFTAVEILFIRYSLFKQEKLREEKARQDILTRKLLSER